MLYTYLIHYCILLKIKSYKYVTMLPKVSVAFMLHKFYFVTFRNFIVSKINYS